jgi:formylglycine-generating enzyme required for sulfatase activity
MDPATPPFTISRRTQVVHTFTQDLGDDIALAMVLIPPGEFLMGSPTDELERYKSEGPQRPVKIVEPFFMGQHPITQAQWQRVASFPKVQRKIDATPSQFQGADLPVEQVSWLDAEEFCLRLSAHAKRPYRLPSEAEWEYACRAGTTTPFHCGETLSTDLANYRGIDEESVGWSGKYGRGVLGEYRQKTTPVGTFPANAFGLYDMHGNVWEWCLDHWHDNYTGAPSDGSAWLDPKAEKNSSRVRRGGSWIYFPRLCRSANRLWYTAVDRYYNLGFRVVYSPARILP